MTGAPAARTERTLLGPATIATVVVGAGCGVAAWAAAGQRGLVSAALGTTTVAGFLLAGQLPVAQAARGRQGTGWALLLFGYTVRVGLGVAALRLLTELPAVHPRALGLTVIACALAWTAGGVWAFARWEPASSDTESRIGEARR